MKKLAFLIASLALCACSKTPAVAPVDDSNRVRRNHFEGSPVINGTRVVTKPVWLLGVPAKWNIEELNVPEGADPRPELKTQSNATYGRGPVKVTVTSATLDKEATEANFGALMVETARSIPELAIVLVADFEVKQSNNKLPASLMAFLASGNIAVFQLSVGYKGRGYVVRCMGDALKSEEVANVCEPIVTSFELR